MSTLDLIKAAVPSVIRAPWCLKERNDAIGVLVNDGDLAGAAALIDLHAEQRHLNVVEICRVTRGPHEAVFARGEPKVAETDAA